MVVNPLTLEDGLVIIYDNKKIVCLVDMARGVCFLSLVLMPLLLSHILAQNSRGSYRENVREKMEQQHEKREHGEEKEEALGWRRRKRSVHGMSFRLLWSTRAVG